MIYVFVLMEGIFYGFGLWWINYLYVWSILAIVVLFFDQQRDPLFWSTVAGFFGLAFGALCALPYFFIGGPDEVPDTWSWKAITDGYRIYRKPGKAKVSRKN